MNKIYSALNAIFDTRERIINVERKIDALMPGKEPGSIDEFSSHADQWFGGRSFSQHGEDLLVVNIFNRLGIDKPSYLDIGAHHPYNISNTALLYRRGSRGINVEANPNLMAAFVKMRPEDINLNVGVAGTSGVMRFYMIDDHSGRNTFNRAEAEKFVAQNPEFSITKTLDVSAITINDVVSNYAKAFFPDFLSLDVEGFDESILKSMDPKLGRPKVICVETIDAKGVDILSLKNYLHEVGFMSLVVMGGNTIFVDKPYLSRLR